MNNNLAEEYKKELLKNSKYKLLFVNKEEDTSENINPYDKQFSGKGNTLSNPTSDNNNTLNSNQLKSFSQITEEQKEEYKRLNQKFKELRTSHSQTLADKEADAYIGNLRDIGEYNRWSLKLLQKWLITFYNGND